MELSRMFNKPESEVLMWTEGFRKTAASLGLPFGRSTITFNTRMAQELSLWAKQEGKGHEFHKATFKKGLGEGKNIALREVLLDIVESVGLSTDDAIEVMEKGLFKEAVDKEWEEARSSSINAVPTMISGNSRLVGAKSYEEILGLVEGNI